MRSSENSILAKLDQPPAAHNWARCNRKERARTVTSLVNLALGFPKTSYIWATRTIQDFLAFHLEPDQARNVLRGKCPPSQYEANSELLEAFLSYAETRKFDAIRVYDEFTSSFKAGPNVSIPVRPTAILRENGVLTPLFVIGWAKNSLDYYQRRILTSIIEDAIFTLTDLIYSPGEILFFPRNGYGVRKVEKWERGTYQLLTPKELKEQVERFIAARDEARPIIIQRLRDRAEK
jgi:hypothetical protein